MPKIVLSSVWLVMILLYQSIIWPYKKVGRPLALGFMNLIGVLKEDTRTRTCLLVRVVVWKHCESAILFYNTPLAKGSCDLGERLTTASIRIACRWSNHETSAPQRCVVSKREHPFFFGVYPPLDVCRRRNIS